MLSSHTSAAPSLPAASFQPLAQMLDKPNYPYETKDCCSSSDPSITSELQPNKQVATLYAAQNCASQRTTIC